MKEVTRRLIEKLAPCGGLIIQDGNNIAPGSPVENISAMMDAAEECRPPSTKPPDRASNPMIPWLHGLAAQ